MGGLEEWQRGTGCRTNIPPVKAALPSPSLPQIPGVSPHTWVGLREARKSQRQQLQNQGSPFIVQPSRAHPPPQAQGAGKQPQSSAQPSKQDHRAAGNGGLGQEGAPSCPLCSSHGPYSQNQSRAKSQTAQTGWVRQQRPRAVSEECAQLSGAVLLPMEHSSLHPTFKESLFQELTEPRVSFDPSGKQRKG